VSAFLLDANLSPETAAFLRATFGYDVVDLASLGLAHLEDPNVVEYARRRNRVIITFDLDIAEIHHRGQHGRFGVILLRLGVQTVVVVYLVLESFFAATAQESNPLERSVVVIDEARGQVTTEP
jgi:predicted nuclease of predicted toxin-antitoxin system